VPKDTQRTACGPPQVHCTRPGPAGCRQPSVPRERWGSFLVTPQTLLRWHRTLVRRKWTYGKERTPGRPPIDPQTVELIFRMARENARWGCMRICGELRKLGIRVGATTIGTLLRRHGLGPAPRRTGPSWTQFLRAQAEAVVACDSFTVETIRLKTLYVLFFIHLSSRRVVAAQVTAYPDTAWVTRQARNAAMELNDRGVSIRFLLRDHDAKFCRGSWFVVDNATVKVDWALDGGVPWTAEAARRTGTVHLAGSMDDLTMHHASWPAG
jgi:putative transposase